MVYPAVFLPIALADFWLKPTLVTLSLLLKLRNVVRERGALGGEFSPPAELQMHGLSCRLSLG